MRYSLEGIETLWWFIIAVALALAMVYFYDYMKKRDRF